MPSKPTESADSPESTQPSGKSSTGTVKDSAQQIWLAGLGAFAKAQEEGSKVFEALVKEGIGMQRKTQAAATEATSKMASMANMAGGFTARAPGPWDKLENIFEDRVAKALAKLGMPTAQDMHTLIARVEELNQSVQKLSAQTSAAKAPSKATSKPAPRKTAAKSAAAAKR